MVVLLCPFVRLITVVEGVPLTLLSAPGTLFLLFHLHVQLHCEGRELGAVEGGGTVVVTYCMRRICFENERKI